MASPSTIRRSWPGVVPIARSSAISRCRCWTDRPSVLATTNMATMIASPPNTPASTIRFSLRCPASGNSAIPRSSPVSVTIGAPRSASATRWRSASVSTPDCATTPIASIRSWCPDSAAASGAGEEQRRLGRPRARRGDPADGEGAFGAVHAQRDDVAHVRAGVLVHDQFARARRGARDQGVRHQLGRGPVVPVRLAAPWQRDREVDVADRDGDAGHRADRVDQSGVEAHPLGQRRVLGVLVLVVRVRLGQCDGLLAGDHDGRAREPLGGHRGADPGLHQPAAGQHDRRAEQDGDEGGEEAALAQPHRAQGKSDHHRAPAPSRCDHAPRWVIRSATASAVGWVNSPTKWPSARKATRSA